MPTIFLDGAQGEGGGQILRSALTLSMITGQPFRLENLRAEWARPGLLRQHLTAVLATAEICGARIEGAALGLRTLLFVSSAIRGGDYRFAVGEHLADQLALPMALAGGGSFTTGQPSSHLTTNLAVIERFLPLRSQIEYAEGRWLVRIG
jgi:RNA 3'-terminal phosphate cyclase (ATP)